jgi:hypothetical protein
MPPRNFYAVMASLVLGRMLYQIYQEHRTEQERYDREFAEITANYE